MTPDQRARDDDRDDAIEIVEAAWADGQIVEADRDRRVEQLLTAQTMAEVRMLVHDLQPPDVPRWTAPVAAPRTGGRPGSVVIAVAVALVLVVGGGLAALLALVAGPAEVEATDQAGVAAPESGAGGADVHSAQGHRDLVADLVSATGSSVVFEAVLYPEYAVLSLPVDTTSQRENRWYWNGAIRDLESRGTSSYDRFDLAEVDMAVVTRLLERVRTMVDDPTTSYVILRAPDPQDGAAVSAYASNEFQEGAHLVATGDGQVIHSSRR